jgi:hypothetical protein
MRTDGLMEGHVEVNCRLPQLGECSLRRAKFCETRSAFKAPLVKEAAGRVVTSLSVCRSH